MISGESYPNLPAELTSFVGRQREVDDLVELMGGSRLVTVVGAGGVGKSRVAVRAAKTVASVRHDGAAYADLTFAGGGASVSEAIAKGLGSGWRNIADLFHYIGDRPLILVVDNCESHADDCAEVFARLLTGCPGVRILATSRQRLYVPGETLYALHPLPLANQGGRNDSDATRLFLDRAREGIPFGEPQPSPAIIAEICSRVEGIPLSIELAAAQLRFLSAKEVLERLDDPLRFLKVDSVVRPERQRTLERSIAWSHQLCTPLESGLWARLSVFLNSYSFDAVEFVGNSLGYSRQESIEAVKGLVDKSILVSHSDGEKAWYTMLTSLRDFGRQLLEEQGRTIDARRLHRDWYVMFAAGAESDWRTPRQPYWLTRFERELPNIRAALEFSLEVPGEADRVFDLLIPCCRHLWNGQGRLEELADWLGRALAVSDRTDSFRVIAECLCALAAAQTDETPTADDYLELARQTVDRVGDIHLHAYITSVRATLSPPGAQRIELAQLALEQAECDPLFLARTGNRLLLALYLDMAGRREEAQALAGEVLDAAESVGERLDRAYLLFGLAINAHRRGESEESLKRVRECLALLQDSALGTQIAYAIELVADIMSTRDDGRDALVLLGLTEAMWEVVGSASTMYAEFQVDRAKLRERLVARAEPGRAEIDIARGRALTVAEGIMLAMAQPSDSGTHHSTVSQPLTQRELAVAGFVALGESDKQIAARLFISARTVEGHVQNIRDKLGLASRTQLANWVREYQRDSG